MRASSAKCVRFGRARWRVGGPCDFNARFRTGSRRARSRAASWIFAGVATLASLPQGENAVSEVLVDERVRVRLRRRVADREVRSGRQVVYAEQVPEVRTRAG